MIIALASPRIASSIDEGLDKIKRLLSEASDQGAEIVCFPEAYLPGLRGQDFNDDDKQVITHFLSPHPLEGGTPRATWQHSRDTSTIWAVMTASSSDPNIVASGAIPW